MSRKRLRAYLIVLAILVNVVNLLPVIQSPYLGDDAWRESCLRGIMSLTQTDLGQICWGTTKDYIKDGRWYPFVVYYYAAFYYLDLFYYKVAGIIFILINVLLFAYLIQLVTRRKSSFLMALLVAPLFFQFRFYHDPILSYYYLMQLELLLIEVSLIFFIRRLRNSKTIYLVMSVLTFSVALLVYEAFYSFCVIYALVAYAELGPGAKKDIIKFSTPFFAITLINVGVSIVIRLYFHTSYEGTTLNLDLWSWITAFFKQVSAAIPLSYFFSSEYLDTALDYVRQYFSDQLVVFMVLWMTLWCFIWDYSYREDVVKTGAGTEMKTLGLMGLGFWILPAVLVTLSAKYQRELKWGLGYLPVYVSVFGLIMLSLMFLTWLNNVLKRMNSFSRRSVAVTTALIGGALVGLNFTNNNIVVHGYNAAEHYHRSLIEKSLSRGLMNDVQEGSFLVFGLPIRSWDEAAFYRMHSGLTLQVVKPPGFQMDDQLGTISYKEAFQDYSIPSSKDSLYDFKHRKVPRTNFAGYSAEFQRAQGVIIRRKLKPNRSFSRPNVFFIKYEAEAKDLGYAVLGHLTRLKTGDNSSLSAVADTIRVYVNIPVGQPYTEILLTGNWINPDSLKKMGAFLFKDKDLNLVSSDEHGKLLEVPMALIEQGIDPKSVVATLTMIEN